MAATSRLPAASGASSTFCDIQVMKMTDSAVFVAPQMASRAATASGSDPAKISEHGLLNSNSILLRIQHGTQVFLFPGDSYGGAFETFLKEKVPAEKLKTTVLTAPHHGFNPGYAFPKMLMPTHVIASCVADYPGNAGTPNPRSPGDRAMDTYTPLGAEVLVTAFHGIISAVSDGAAVKVTKTHERTTPRLPQNP